MGKRVLLGEFELLVLAAVLRLGSEAYGANVYRELGEKCDRHVSLGAVYTTLSRLEGKNLVTSELGESTPVRGGRAKRYFTITNSGKTAVSSSSRALMSLLQDTELAWT